MKIKASYLPYIGVGAGAAALLVRFWLFMTGVDGKGLIVATHPGNALSYILVALMMGVLFLAVWPLKKVNVAKVTFKPGVPACVGTFAAGIGVLFTTFYELAGKSGFIDTLACILGVVAAVCFVVTGLCRLKGKTPSYYLHSVITLYFMLHLLSQYRHWNIEPQLQNYFPQLLASAFLMITAYQRAALDGGNGRPEGYLFFNYGALFFSCASIVGDAPVFYLTMALWTLTAGCPVIKKGAAPMELPEDVKKCIDRLEKAGFKAYVVGGCVRDHLLGLMPHDYDLCTNARPEQICEIFASHRLVLSGEKHGTIGVVMGQQVYEITTFRTEGGYSDNRHPDDVTFVGTVQEDLARRDFTVNAMAFSPKKGFVDPFDGQTDLKNKCLRAVGDPETRFREDALRILRGIRFAARFSLQPEKKTLQAMFDCAPLMDNLAAERVLTELCDFLVQAGKEDLLRYKQLLVQVIPELADCVNFDQNNPNHKFDVYTHIAHTVAAVPNVEALRLAALLHDIGKPRCYTEDETGCGHFYGHGEISAEMANEILLRLKASTALRERVVFLTEKHMDLFAEDKKLIRRKLSKWGEEAARQLMALQKADFQATGKSAEEVKAAYSVREAMLEELLREESCFSVKDLAVDGNDLMEMGMMPGPEIGDCLNALLEQVLDETLPNEKEALTLAAKAFMEKL